MSGHSKWRDIPAVRRFEEKRAAQRLRVEIALVALELAAGWETADDLVIELDDGRVIKVLEGGEHPPPGPPLAPPW